ncbi:MAG: response regulator [Bacteroidetes bacterium]|nr:MAG: response regulator [Bacteroidota bacterium]
MKEVLVIDDDELDLELLRIVLTKEHYIVYSTADGPQGILLYQHHKPSLVFLDLGLPSMSGIDVLREIRLYDSSANVVLITGYASTESAASAGKLGAIDYIEKSWDVEVMVKRIKECLQRFEENINCDF